MTNIKLKHLRIKDYDDFKLIKTWLSQTYKYSVFLFAFFILIFIDFFILMWPS